MIGGVIGVVIGGVIGAVIGGVIGVDVHVVDVSVSVVSPPCDGLEEPLQGFAGSSSGVCLKPMRAQQRARLRVFEHRREAAQAVSARAAARPRRRDAAGVRDDERVQPHAHLRVSLSPAAYRAMRLYRTRANT
ncbi:MAG TPA: hypothetical protein VH081_06150 [Solirubrobacteraceae bacterium]|nr:hypothetical protein [Solirubrobacteraceae bacterium]